MCVCVYVCVCVCMCVNVNVCVCRFELEQNAVLSEQKGVYRVNCLDCLDRTNVVQSYVAKEVLLTMVSCFLCVLVCLLFLGLFCLSVATKYKWLFVFLF